MPSSPESRLGRSRRHSHGGGGSARQTVRVVHPSAWPGQVRHSQRYSVRRSPVPDSGISQRRVRRESMPVPAQLSYSSGTSDVPLLGDTIGANLDRTVAAFPDREALVDCASGRRWTYREFVDDVNTVALGLAARGIGKGDRVGIWSPNRAEWTLVQYATAKLGAILVNINPAYRTHELTYVLDQAGIRMLIAAPSFKTSDYAAMIDEARPDCPKLTDVILFDGPSWDDVL